MGVSSAPLAADLQSAPYGVGGNAEQKIQEHHVMSIESEKKQQHSSSVANICDYEGLP